LVFNLRTGKPLDLRVLAILLVVADEAIEPIAGCPLIRDGRRMGEHLI
jgi:hypothetical protein